MRTYVLELEDIGTQKIILVEEDDLLEILNHHEYALVDLSKYIGYTIHRLGKRIEVESFEEEIVTKEIVTKYKIKK